MPDCPALSSTYRYMHPAYDAHLACVVRSVLSMNHDSRAHSEVMFWYAQKAPHWGYLQSVMAEL